MHNGARTYVIFLEKPPHPVNVHDPERITPLKSHKNVVNDDKSSTRRETRCNKRSRKTSCQLGSNKGTRIQDREGLELKLTFEKLNQSDLLHYTIDRRRRMAPQPTRERAKSR